jgi:putative acetyltransferase
MIPLYEAPWFTFRFADDRLIPRFHLEGIEKGRQVSVIKIDPETGERRDLLAKAIVGEGGWVDLPGPITVRAGEAFIAAVIMLRDEIAQDHDAVRQVNRLAFGQEAEGRLVDALRTSGCARASLVAEIGGRVVGHIMFSDLTIVTDTGAVSALALAPLAVLPDWQRLGIGSALVRRGLEICKEIGHRIVVVLGHPEYYPRFGFSAKLAERLQSPFGSGPSHMAMELAPGALDGVVGKLVYSPPFNDL